MSKNLPTPTTRRDLLKKAAFVAPIVLSLPAGAAFAKQGSGRGHGRGHGHGHGRGKDKEQDD